MKYKKLNIDWNAEPNAPEAKLERLGEDLRIEFFLNSFMFDNIEEDDKGELKFIQFKKYSFNSCNDEGYFRGQYRYNDKELPWGEFYEIFDNERSDFSFDTDILNDKTDKIELRHFIIFFRDNILECIAKDFEFKYLNKKTVHNTA